MTAKTDKKDSSVIVSQPGEVERLQGIDGRYVEKIFDWERLDITMSLGCDMSECVGIMRLSESTICRKIRERYDMTFGEYREICMAPKKVRLRSGLWDVALKDKNPTIMIWMSKNNLGYSDKISAEVTAEVRTINFAYNVPGNRFAPKKKPDVIEIKEEINGSED